MTTEPDLDLAARRATDWLYHAAMPLWLEHGVDWARGGFYESLTTDDLRPATAFKRLRVLTRQIYVFTEGALYGVERAGAAVDQAIAFLLDHARSPDGGFASRQDMDGRITDPTRDLYDLSFVLFALAHGYRLAGDDRLKTEALSLVRFIRTQMRHPAGGYVEGLPPRAPRRQNPHMHLLEAALAGLEHMPDPAFAELVDELTTLCRQRFLGGDGDRLFEYFTDDLSQPLRPTGSAVTEPGHHLEWAWLFQEVARVRGVRIDGGEALAQFALDAGLDRKTGFLRGEVFEDGAVSEPTVRLWAHGEWLKAALRVAPIRSTWPDAWRAMERFLDMPNRGVWREQWDPVQGAFVENPAPASSLYHITTAIVELRRSATLTARA